MIKYILRLSIAAFIIIFTYDTINFYFENSKVPKENQVVFVRPKVEVVEQKITPEPFPDYYKDYVFWYGGLGAVSAASIGVLCYALSAATSKASMSNNDPKPVKGNADSGKKESQREIVSSENVVKSCSGELNEEKESDKNEELDSESAIQNSGIIKLENNDSQQVSTVIMGSSVEKESVGETRSFESQPPSRQSIEEPPMTPKLTENQEDDTGENLLEENLSEQLTENLLKHSKQELYEDSDVLVGSRIILDSEISYKSRGSLPKEMMLVSLPEQILAALTSLQAKSESGVCPTLLTQDDLDKFELRLSSIESKVAVLENSSSEYAKRLEMAETELVDLHEQMYTILTKLEEEQKPNYIIVSQMSMLDEMKESIIKEAIPPKTDSKLIEYNQVQENIESEKVREIEKNEDQHAKIPKEKNIPENLGNNENTASSGDQLVPQQGTRLKSVGLEAILLKEIPPKSSTAPPKKANPKVPTHYVQPYKRSSFTATDSMSDIRKVSRRLMKARTERFR